LHSTSLGQKLRLQRFKRTTNDKELNFNLTKELGEFVRMQAFRNIETYANTYQHPCFFKIPLKGNLSFTQKRAIE
jgi:hypothetical protein